MENESQLLTHESKERERERERNRSKTRKQTPNSSANLDYSGIFYICRPADLVVQTKDMFMRVST